MAITFVRKSWTDQILNRLARSVTYTPVTKTTDNITGDETLTDGTPASYNMVFLKMDDKWYFDKNGLIEGGDAYTMVSATVLTPTRNSKITVDGETYRIQDVHIYYSDNNNSTALFSHCNLFKITG